MGLFKKRATDPAEIDRLKSEIAAMAARLEEADRRLADATQRLDATDTEKSELGERVRGVAERLDATDSAQIELGERVRGIAERLATPLAPPPEEPPPPTVDPAALDAVTRRLDELAARLDTVDTRVTSIATELAHQIDELSSELDSRDSAPPATPPTDEVVAELRDAQTRLANEQARYQIAFRQDLAQLADRLRRS